MFALETPQRLVSQTCGGGTTFNDANAEMHALGFPHIGITPVCNVSVTVSVSSSVSCVDYCSPVAEYGVIWRTRLCPEDVYDLPSYEEAVLGMAALAVESDSDMDTSA